MKIACLFLAICLFAPIQLDGNHEATIKRNLLWNDLARQVMSNNENYAIIHGYINAHKSEGRVSEIDIPALVALDNVIDGSEKVTKYLKGIRDEIREGR